MNLVDSCGWLEYFKGGSQAEAFESYLQEPDLLVPTVVLYGVYKVLRRDLSERGANLAATRLKTYQVVPLDDHLALEAADISLEHELPMADAIIYATAQAHGATLVTSDEHLDGLPGVVYLAKPSD